MRGNYRMLTRVWVAYFSVLIRFGFPCHWLEQLFRVTRNSMLLLRKLLTNNIYQLIIKIQNNRRSTSHFEKKYGV